MKNDNLNTILSELAENAAPTYRIDLWPALKNHLETSEWQIRNKEKLHENRFARKHVCSPGCPGAYWHSLSPSPSCSPPHRDAPGRRVFCNSLPAPRAIRSLYSLSN